MDFLNKGGGVTQEAFHGGGYGLFPNMYGRSSEPQKAENIQEKGLVTV